MFTPDADTYVAQMNAYRRQRAAATGRRKRPADSTTRSERLHLCADEEALRLQRRHQRFLRQDEEADWQAARAARRAQRVVWQALPPAAKRQHQATFAAWDQAWRQRREVRRQQLATRQAEDKQWRGERTLLRRRRAALAPSTSPPQQWLAILVVVDNCTRRCLGLPLFTAGVHVTSQMVVDALRPLIPASVQFVISDNGSQFTGRPFADLAQACGFGHVRIAPYRPRTNGIAERFVRTLKEWLAHHRWSQPGEVEALLTEMRRVYNARPHQGRELAGRSPDAYASYLASTATC